MSSRRQSHAAASPKPPDEPNDETELRMCVVPVRWNWLSSPVILLEYLSRARGRDHTVHFFMSAENCYCSQNYVRNILLSTRKRRDQHLKTMVVIL